MKIGFIGLGIMGVPMAKNLAQSGYELALYARRNEVLLQFPDAIHCSSPFEVAKQSEIIITIVSDTPDVREVMYGKNGLLDGLNPGSIYIDMSTIESSLSKEIYNDLKNRGISSLDAPCSGGNIGAEKGTLSIMVGGEKEAFDNALPVLKTMGSNIIYVGEAGAGQICKSCNQIAVANNLQGTIEALSFAKKAGVDVARVREALLGGFAASKVMDHHGSKIIERNFDPGFKIDLFRKDLNIVLQTAKKNKIPLPTTSIIASEMDSMIAQHIGEEDFSGLVQIIEQLGNVQL